MFKTTREALYPQSQEPVRTSKVDRNEPCPCDSGKKYQQGCFALMLALPATACAGVRSSRCGGSLPEGSDHVLVDRFDGEAQLDRA
jgi:hypothetical protein